MKNENLLPNEQLVESLPGTFLIADKKGFDPCPWAHDVAQFCPAKPGDRVLDLGCGNGVLLVALKRRYPDVGALLGIELDERVAEQARRNFELLDISPAETRAADLRDLPFEQAAFDLVVTNPPFYPPNWGRQSSQSRKASSTHELHGNIADFAKAARYALAPGGRVVFLYDQSRLTTLCLAIENACLTLRALEFLEDDRGLPSRVLALCDAESDGLKISLKKFQPREIIRKDKVSE